jgi:hypothetical protein
MRNTHHLPQTEFLKAVSPPIPLFVKGGSGILEATSSEAGYDAAPSCRGTKSPRPPFPKGERRQGSHNPPLAKGWERRQDPLTPPLSKGVGGISEATSSEAGYGARRRPNR